MTNKYQHLEYCNNLPYSKICTSSFVERFKDNVFCQNWYAAFCNNAFLVDGTHVYSVSWRSAGDDVADIRNFLNYSDYKEDYMDWYCSGIGHDNPDIVSESEITEEVKNCLKEIGFELIPDYYD